MPQERKYISRAQRQAAYRQRCKCARQIEQTSRGLPALPAISNFPGWPRWKASIRMVRELLQQTTDEMQEYYDERTEEWLEGDRAEEHLDRIDSVQEILDTVSELDW